MKYTAKLTGSRAGYCAQCIEVDATGEGETKEAAVASLRNVLQDRYEHVEGVALPPLPPSDTVEIVLMDEVSDASQSA
jgi:hypothetical protein